MNAQEIRETPLNTEASLQNAFGSKAVSFEFWLREIAAQLAEQNELVREQIRKREEREAKENRVAPPVGEPEHLGCIMKDGKRIIISGREDGPIELGEEDAARVLAMVTPVAEVKPQ